MKSYGIDMVGEFFIDSVDTKPHWNEAYIGRMIYAEDTDNYWLGGVTKWVPLGYGENTVDEFALNTGHGYRQINARTIPFIHTAIAGDNVYEAIVSLATGEAFYDACLESRMFKPNQITSEHISFGTTGFQVSANNIPVKSYFVDNLSAEIITVQEAINQLELTAVKVTRVTVQSTAWTFVPAENLYRATLVALPITTFPILVQCYGENGSIIIPTNIEMDDNTQRIYVWHTESITMTAIMVG